MSKAALPTPSPAPGEASLAAPTRLGKEALLALARALARSAAREEFARAIRPAAPSANAAMPGDET